MFKKKQKGIMNTLEWIISAPVTFSLMFLSCMFVLFIFNYYLYSHTASQLAQEMNMGDIGYETHVSSSTSITTDTYTHSILYVPIKTGKKTINYGNGLYCTDGFNGCFKKTFNYYLKDYANKGNLDFAYSSIDSIECRVYYNGVERTGFNTWSNSIESGDMVEVKINYKFLGLFNITTYGTSFII